MKTREVLLASETALSVELKQMKIKELERHIEKILASVGVGDHKTVISSVIKALPEIDDQDRYQRIQNIIAQKIPASNRQKNVSNEILPKITIMIVVLITKQFEKIHRERH